MLTLNKRKKYIGRNSSKINPLLVFHLIGDMLFLFLFTTSRPSGVLVLYFLGSTFFHHIWFKITVFLIDFSAYSCFFIWLILSNWFCVSAFFCFESKGFRIIVGKISSSKPLPGPSLPLLLIMILSFFSFSFVCACEGVWKTLFCSK